MVACQTGSEFPPTSGTLPSEVTCRAELVVLESPNRCTSKERLELHRTAEVERADRGNHVPSGYCRHYCANDSVEGAGVLLEACCVKPVYDE